MAVFGFRILFSAIHNLRASQLIARLEMLLHVDEH